MKSSGFLLLFFLCATKLQAQQMVQYQTGFNFREGVYLSFGQFKNNNPIPKNAIISKFDRNDAEFLSNILNAKTFSFKDEKDSVRTMKVEETWGFSRNGIVFIRVEDEFNRIAVLGSISHFIATITVFSSPMTSPFSDPFYAPFPGQSSSEEMHQMILDFQTGRTTDFSQESLETILQRDTRLSDEFSHLKKSQKKDMLFLYLRKYNEKHPIFFPAE